MPGSLTTPDRPSAREIALVRFAFRSNNSVGIRSRTLSWLDGWPMRSPTERFADILAGACARLGADAGRYSFIAVDSHHLLLAGLPAHYLQSQTVWPPRL